MLNETAKLMFMEFISATILIAGDGSNVSNVTMNATTLSPINVTQSTEAPVLSENDGAIVAITTAAPIEDTPLSEVNLTTVQKTIVNAEGNIEIVKQEIRTNAQGLLYSKMLENYNLNTRPVMNLLKQTRVNFEFVMEKFVDLQETEQTLILQGYFKVKWIDEFMRWNDTETGVKRLKFNSAHVWIPDIFVKLKTGGGYEWVKDSWSPFDVIFTPDGKASFSPAGELRVLCEVKMKNFPFDETVCTLEIQSWTYQLEEQKFIIAEDASDGNGALKIMATAKNVQWSITEHNGYELCQVQSGGMYSLVRIGLRIRRKPMFYVLMIILPCMTLLLISCANFLLPIEHGQRFAISIAIIVSLSVFQVTINDVMPETSDVDQTPIIFYWLMGIMVVVFESMVADAALQNLIGKRSPLFIQRCNLVYLAIYLAQMIFATGMTYYLIQDLQPQRLGTAIGSSFCTTENIINGTELS